MKKLFLAFALAAYSLSYAQFPQKMESPADLPIKIIEKAENSSNNNFKTNNVEGWYIATDIVTRTNIGANLSTTVQPLIQDSNVFLQFADSRSNGSWFAAGHVLDPKDIAILNSNNPQLLLSRHVSYRVDSIRFRYAYTRFVDSIQNDLGENIPLVDTLLVFYHAGQQIQKSSFTGSADAVPIVGFNHTTKLPSATLRIDTLLLTNEDSTAISPSNTGVPESIFTTTTIALAAPPTMAINALNGSNVNNLVGATIAFRTAPYISGNLQDTAYILNQTTNQNLKRANSFWYQALINQSENVRLNNPTTYNISHFAISWQAYGQNQNWRNVMVAGSGFTRERYMNMDFYLTTTSGNVSLNEIKNGVFVSTDVYPNPARQHDKAVIGFNLKERCEVKGTLSNMMGQKVRDLFHNSYSDGLNAEHVNINGLKPGIYFITLEVNGTSISKKLTITE